MSVVDVMVEGGVSELATDRFVASLVGYKAFQLSKKPEFSDADRPDLHQHLLSAVSEGLKTYDPALCPYKHYVRSLVNNKVSDLLRRRRARKRAANHICSLNVDIQDEEGRSVELLQTIGQRELDQRIGRERRLSDEDLCDLKMDLQSVISKLDPIAQEIVRRQATQSITEISRDLGIPRSTLNDWMLQIRKLFEKAGFERYLES